MSDLQFLMLFALGPLVWLISEISNRRAVRLVAGCIGFLWVGVVMIFGMNWRAKIFAGETKQLEMTLNATA